MAREQDLESVRQFANDSKSIEEGLKQWLGGFNLFEILGIARAEIRHSSFLAWMMDPGGIHEMRGRFLRELFCKLTDNSKNSEKDYGFLKDIDLNQAKVKVDREYSNSDFNKQVRIDIRVVIHDQHGETVVVIENKIGAGERETEDNGEEVNNGQLKDYKELTDDEFSRDSKKVFIFLTPDGKQPEDEGDSMIWGVLSYEDVVQCLTTIRDELKNSCHGCFKTETLFLIDNYIQCLRRHVVKDAELIKTCKELYAKHHIAIDCIKKTIEDEKSRVIGKARDLINQTLQEVSNKPDCNLIYCQGRNANHKNPTFQTETLNKYLPPLNEGVKGSWGNRAVYFYWFDIKYVDGKICYNLCLEFGGLGLEDGSDTLNRMKILYKAITGKEFEFISSTGNRKGKQRQYHQTWDWNIKSGIKFDLDVESDCNDLVKSVRNAVGQAMEKEKALLEKCQGPTQSDLQSKQAN